MYKDNNSFEAKYAPFIDEFFSTFKVGNILHSCGGAKLRGISPVEVLKYLFSVVFTNSTLIAKLLESMIFTTFALFS